MADAKPQRKGFPSTVTPRPRSGAPLNLSNAERIALVLSVALLVASCGGGLSDAQSSGIEGVPIPVEAWATGEGEWTVDVAYDEVRAWYERQMPIGVNFTPWTWCEANTVGPEVLQRLYGRAGTNQMLSVLLGSNPSRISIVVDESGPC